MFRRPVTGEPCGPRLSDAENGIGSFRLAGGKVTHRPVHYCQYHDVVANCQAIVAPAHQSEQWKVTGIEDFL